MCRLTVLTRTPHISHLLRSALFNTTMLAAAMEGQTDGAGIWDGKTVAKVYDLYPSLSPVHINLLDPASVWLGHVRKASAGTGSRVVDAHPYEFMPVAGAGKLIVAHNGYARGTTVRADDLANTDSYRAARALAETITKGQRLGKLAIEEWLATFSYGSEWSFTITYMGYTYIVRGQREIYALNLGSNDDGVLFNTSANVLSYAREFVRMAVPGLKMEPVCVSPHTLITIDPTGAILVEPYHYVAPVAPALAPYLWVSDPDGNVKTAA